ncbi:MAG: [protein-PII] uridylyltransferase [Dongiaceae bacterium]
MNAIRDQRSILDRRRLGDALVEAGGADPAGAPGVLTVLKQALAAGRAEVRRRFESGASDGRMAARETSFLMDQLIRTLYDFTNERAYRASNPSAGERIALVAVGGYGRGELAPFSDIDLLFLLPYKQTPHGEQVVEFMLYKLWDLGLKVGQAARSIDECLRQARADVTIRTSLLEARFLWGERPLFQELRGRFFREVVTGTGLAFVEAKLAERDERHRRMGNSRYALEPNIKDGKGGLRDLHTLFWIGKYLYRAEDAAALVEQAVLTAEEAAIFERAGAFLWTLRTHLHYVAGRAEERLTFDLQGEMARRMSYQDGPEARGVERFMKDYFANAKQVGDLTRIFCAAIEAAHQKKPRFSFAAMGLWRREVEGFAVDGGRLMVEPGHFAARPVDLLRLFEVAQRLALDIHPASLRLVTQSLALIDDRLRADPEANRLFLAMLTSPKDPEAALRRLSEAGVFGRFLPDFGRVVALMQYDMYHHYTVDEHTLFAIGQLHAIEQGRLKPDAPIASRVVHEVLSRRVLYLALLLHDIAKGRGGDHSELGAGIALELGPRLGFAAEETETVSWLVRWHLLMSNTAFTRDIDDPKTIADFVAEVQSLERLRLLLVLTVADIRAVGPKTWNGWKATLLRELYYRAEELLSGGLARELGEARVGTAWAALAERLADWPEAERAAHRERGSPAYWLAFDAETLARHARLVRRAEADGQPLALDSRVDGRRGITEVTVYTADRPGLFARLAGGIALAGATVVDARIFTLKNGKALDSFSIQDAEGGPFDRPDKLARLAARLALALEGDGEALRDLDRQLSVVPSRLSVFTVAPRVLIDNGASASHTVVEVNGRDRRGLLYRLTHALAGLKLQISSAKISTFGERAVDVFYVKDRFGLKIEDESRTRAIREALLPVLAEGAPPAAQRSAAE